MSHTVFTTGPRAPPTCGCQVFHTAPERTAVWCHHSDTGFCSLESELSWKVAWTLLLPALTASPSGLRVQSQTEGTHLKHKKDKRARGVSAWTHWWTDLPAGARRQDCRFLEPASDVSPDRTIRLNHSRKDRHVSNLIIINYGLVSLDLNIS